VEFLKLVLFVCSFQTKFGAIYANLNKTQCLNDQSDGPSYVQIIVFIILKHHNLNVIF